MNIKAIIGSGVVVFGIGLGAVYLLSQPSPKGSLYQEDEFISVTSVEEVKPEITVKTPEQIQPAEAIKQDTADQSNEAVEPAITSDASQVEIEAPPEVMEPVIVERDPTEATERGFTVTVYPHETNYFDQYFEKSLPLLSPETLPERNRMIKEKRDNFRYDNVPIGVYNTNQLMETDENGRIPLGIVAPRRAKYVAEGYIHIEQDGFYYIYPMEDRKWTPEYIAQNGGSDIYVNNKYRITPVSDNRESRITIEVANNVIFDKAYHGADPMIFQQVYLHKGVYPIKITFAGADYVSYHINTLIRTRDFSKGAFPGINIMQRKVSDSSDLGFLYKNKRQANIFTVPISQQDDASQANIENPRQIKYLNIANDIKTEHPTTLTRTHISYKHLDPVHNIIFDFIPKESGMFIFANKTKPHYIKSLHQAYTGGNYYGCLVGFSVDGNRITEYKGFILKSANAYNMYEIGGKGYFVDVAEDQVGKNIHIEMNYQCITDNNEYTFSTLLKTPGNNSFLPLEAFAE